MPTCSKCGAVKDQSEFFKDRQKVTTGHRPDCKECNQANNLEWARSNKEARKKHTLKFAYGLELSKFEEMERVQNYSCAICGKSDDDRKLSVDHCHTTKKIRGLLCRKCNVGLGYFNDNVELLNSAIRYLTKE